MTGIGRYLSELVHGLPSSDAENQYVLFTYRELPGFSGANMRNVPTVGRPPKGRFQKLFSPWWMNVILPRFIKEEKIDVFFSPNNLLPVRSRARANIVAIMDVFPFIDPSFHSPLYRAYAAPFLRRSAGKADHILTVSECSKRDIVKFFGVPEGKVSVTYLSADKRFTPREIAGEERKRFIDKYRLPGRFILYVGVIEKRKNIEGIIRIADLLNKPSDPPIVLVGRPGYGGKEYIGEIRKRSNMKYCDFAEEGDLPYFYNIASAFIFPSWYEGFGLPPLEAMQSGLPVVASNHSSLPEVIGDAGVLLEPGNYGGFAENIRMLMGDKEKWEALRAAGIARAARFDAKKTARETVQVFKDCLQRLKDI